MSVREFDKKRLTFILCLDRKSKPIMGKKKTTNRGRKPKGKYSELSKDDKKKYHNNALRKHRGQSPTNPDTIQHSTSASTPTSSRHNTPASRGRPPLTGLIAMTPTKLLGRKRYIMSEKRKKERRVKRATHAARLRFSSPESTGTGDVSSEDEEMVLDEEMDLHEDTNEVDEVQHVDMENVAGPAPALFSPDALRKSVYRAKCRLRGILTNDSMDNLKLLHLYSKKIDLPFHISTELIKLDCVCSSDQRLYKYRIQRLQSLFESLNTIVIQHLLRFWFENVLLSKVAESVLTTCNVITPDELLPRSVKVHRTAAIVAAKYLGVSSKLPKDIRINGVNYIIDVVKQNNLQPGDATLLSNTTNCSVKFARKVLNAVATGAEEQLRNLRKERFDSIHVTEWPSKISEFVFRPENSRATPGQDTVSVSYGVRKPKYILLHSRTKIAQDFKNANPECKFSISTIKREFPPNAITPTTRDNERNTCPTHANVRRIVRALNNIFRKNNVDLLPSSCRELCTKVMCLSASVSSEEPISWVESCVLGSCSLCPKLDITYPPELGQKEVKFSTWESRKIKITKTNQKTKKVCSFEKSVFSLYSQTIPLDQCIEQLKSMIPNLRLHIYTAHKQWKAHEILRSNLVPGSIITIEDYQMNLEVSYGEAPTSVSYSANKISVAMYPLCVEYLNDEGTLCKGGIVFLSEDKLHDHQQIEEFEKKAFEILSQHIPYQIKNWKRFSDGCGAQFWSGYVIANLFKMKDELGLSSISYDRFEAHEGKSVSDTLGSISKCAFQRGIVKSDEGIADLSEVIELIKSELNVSTKKFLFFEVVSFDFIERSTERAHLAIPLISKLHSAALNGTKVISHRWSCTDCTVSMLCESCKVQSGFDMKAAKMKKSKSKKQDNKDDEDDDIPVAEQFYDDDDNGQTDDEDEEDDQIESDDDESDEEIDDEFQPGDIVWGLHGRIWYPGLLCSISDVPENVRENFRVTNGRYIIWWYGDEKFSLVTRVEKLGITQADSKRASRSGAMQKLYNQALSDLI